VTPTVVLAAHGRAHRRRAPGARKPWHAGWNRTCC